VLLLSEGPVCIELGGSIAHLANGGNRRIFLVAASSNEGHLIEHRTAAQPWRRELVFMPEVV
jgi:hypothetical protein